MFFSIVQTLLRKSLLYVKNIFDRCLYFWTYPPLKSACGECKLKHIIRIKAIFITIFYKCQNLSFFQRTLLSRRDSTAILCHESANSIISILKRACQSIKYILSNFIIVISKPLQSFK